MKNGSATIKIYECDNKHLEILARAIVVTKILVVWDYALFSDGTYTCRILTASEEINGEFSVFNL